MKKTYIMLIVLLVLLMGLPISCNLLLYFDMPMEFGGGAAHKALATLGRPGLNILIKRASSENNINFDFACSAINGIRNPALLPDLDTLARRTDMPSCARLSAVGAIAYMADEKYMDEPSEEAKAILISLFKDGDSVTKQASADFLFKILDADEAKELFESVYQDPQLDQETRDEIAGYLPALGHLDLLDDLMDRLIDRKTPGVEKAAAFRAIMRVDHEKYPQMEQFLERGLKILDEHGQPYDEMRCRVWLRIYERHGKKLPIELRFDLFESDGGVGRKLKNAASPIINSLSRELMQANNSYSVEYSHELALEEVKRVAIQWRREDHFK